VIVVGLTGSIAMGKSETAKMFASRGIPVFDSDAAVHALYQGGGGAVPAIKAIAPSAVVRGSVDRQKLAAMVQEHPALLAKIEDSVHPLVKELQKQFLASANAQGADVVVLDIPLLFETGREKDVDVVIVVSASEQLQRQRALRRPDMTPEKLDFVMSRQLPDQQKRARADYVIDTSEGFDETARAVERVVKDLKARARR
jgi:dephospho-CoA kinase